LTDKHFADKLRRLLAKRENPDKNDMLLLKVGRHFEAPSGGQIVIGRNEAENARIEQLKKPEDWLLAAREWLGPAALVRGPRIDDPDLESAARMTAGYGKGQEAETVEVVCRRSVDDREIVLKVEPDKEPVTA
jgi:predicted ribosome quality control (RQC) complex YloA/Tae2 family protein